MSSFILVSLQLAFVLSDSWGVHDFFSISLSTMYVTMCITIKKNALLNENAIEI